MGNHVSHDLPHILSDEEMHKRVRASLGVVFHHVTCVCIEGHTTDAWWLNLKLHSHDGRHWQLSLPVLGALRIMETAL